jgi:hypothetical protein
MKILDNKLKKLEKFLSFKGLPKLQDVISAVNVCVELINFLKDVADENDMLREGKIIFGGVTTDEDFI